MSSAVEMKSYAKEDQDDDDEEFAGLLITSPNRFDSGSSSSPRQTSYDDTKSATSPHGKQNHCCSSSAESTLFRRSRSREACSTLLLIAGVFLVSRHSFNGNSANNDTNSIPDESEDDILVASIELKPDVTKLRSKAKDSGNNSTSQLTCPENVGKSSNDNTTGDYFVEYEAEAAAHVNKTLKDFKTMTLDGWGIEFGEFREMLRPWKEEVFVSNIQSGDSIYESACGVGLNLFLTAEVLREHNITDITVSGNDYVGTSVGIANKIWSKEEEAKQLARTGLFCRGDSSNLDYIPDESFDFVYTGYIDPMIDPLNRLPSDMSGDDKWEADKESCNAGDQKNKRLVKQGQEAQNDWFASWVEELIRLARPGKGIAIENGAESLCKNQRDWGGVDKDWWGKAIKTYQWDVDPTSLVIRDEERVEGGNWRDTRYHVFIRKNE